MRRAAEVALTFAIAAAGGLAATAVGLPVPWLIGSALFVAAANLSGVPIRMPALVRDAAFVILGALAGSSVTPDVLHQILLWPASFAIQMAGVFGVIVLTMLFLRRGLGWDRETAFFASIPGALSLVVATASQTKADLARVLVVQSVRLLVLILLLTPFLAWLEGGASGEATVSRGIGASELSAATVALFAGTVLFAAFVGDRLRLPGGILVGALLASAVLHGSQIAPLAIPDALVLFGLVAIGIVIGERIRHEHRRELGRLLPVALVALLIGFAAAAVSGVVAHVALGIDLGRIAVAYAPGALEALTAIAYQFNIDPAYVAAHHVVRFVALSLSIPFLAKWLAGTRRPIEATDGDRTRSDA